MYRHIYVECLPGQYSRQSLSEGTSGPARVTSTYQTSLRPPVSSKVGQWAYIEFVQYLRVPRMPIYLSDKLLRKNENNRHPDI